MTDDRLNRAIELVRAGKVKESREQLELILKANPSHVSAWLWYAGTWPAASQRIRILEACLHYNPTDQQVQEALHTLKSQQTNAGQPQIGTDAKLSTPRQVSTFIQPIQASNSHRRPVTEARESASASKTKPPIHGKVKGNRLLQWLMWGLAGILAAFCLTGIVLLYNSVPKDPSSYRHDQPSEYYLYVPKSYSAGQEWPLFVGIHGSGGTGRDCWNLWQPYADKEGFILLCPSLSDSGGGWYQDDGEAKLFNSVNQVKAEYRVGQRMFLAGFSAGAFFIQGVAYHYPQSVSGLSILSSGNYLSPTMLPLGIPILVVIGDRDHPAAVQGCQAFVGGLSQYGFDVQYELLPGVGHAVTNKGKQLTIASFRKAIGK